MFKKTVAILLACVLLTACGLFASCSASPVVMRYKNKTLTEADYAYVMAFIKGYYEYYYSQMASYYGSSVNLDSLWDNKGADGSTFAENMTKTVNESCMMLLITEQLAEENGLEVQDEQVLSTIKDAMEQLKVDAGGEDALQIQLAKKGFSLDQLERYELYTALLSLLKDYRYGENGAARIPEEDIRKAFADSYVKSEAYLFPFYTTDESGNRVPNVLDLTASISDETVRQMFLKTFVKVEYLSYEEEAQANDALAKLEAGTDPADLYADAAAHVQPSCVSAGEAEQAMYAGIEVDGRWHLVSEEDGFYVIRKSGVGETDLPGMEQTVREAIEAEEAAAYFQTGFVTVEHILYDDEEKAKSVYDGILAHTTSFADHTSETKDSGTTYTFPRGRMVAPFENAAFEMKEDEYRLVQTDYGWHLMHRLPLDLSQYSEEDAIAAMSRSILEDEAKELFETMKKAGDAYVFEKPADDAHYSYSEPTLMEASSLNADMASALKEAQEGELLYLPIRGSGVYLFRKVQTDDADIQSVYDAVSEPLVNDAFYQYVSQFYDQVTVDSDALAKFNIRTAESYYY